MTRTDVILELGRLRRLPPPALDDFESRMVIIEGLIAMRRAGVFRMVYCDADRLAVVLPSKQDLKGSVRQQISWIEAERMIEEFERQRKMALVAGGRRARR
jgi:hypothetical protein